METDQATDEEANFLNVGAVRQIDALYAHSGTASARLNAAEGKIIGPGKSLKVTAGSTVTMEVFAKYGPVGNTTNLSQLAAGLFASALSGNLATSFEQIGNTVPDALLNDDGLALLAASNTAGEGGAYLNYILFDENYIPVDYGFQRLDQSAQGTLAEHQQLTLVANVKKNGYLYT